MDGHTELQVAECTHVVLLGDSVLDNQFWIWWPPHDVAHKLRQRLEPSAKVTNLAVDESTISDVVQGMTPMPQYRLTRWLWCMEGYPADIDGVVLPLSQLRVLNPKPTHAVLSIGGNDARSAFIQSFDVDGIYRTMVRRGIVTKFDQLIEDILEHVPGKQLVLVVVYHPQITLCPCLHMLPPQRVLTELIARFAPMFAQAALRHGLPIVDASRTLNPYDSRDYGSTPIEPSARGGDFIAALVAHAMEQHSFGEEACVYSGRPGEVQCTSLEEFKRQNDETQAECDKRAQRWMREQLQEHLEKSRWELGAWLCWCMPQSFTGILVVGIEVFLVVWAVQQI